MFRGLFTSLVLCFTLLFPVIFSAQSQVNWLSLEEAVLAQEDEPRKIVMDVYTSWCGPCKMMMANTFTNPDVIAYLNQNFYAVKFDAESKDPIRFKGHTFENPNFREGVRGRNSTHQLSRELRVNAYPTLVYFDEEAELIAPISGYKSPGQLEMYLKFFAQNFSSEVQQEQWEAFRDNFKPSWR
jgi:thioredoxin-related protein